MRVVLPRLSIALAGLALAAATALADGGAEERARQLLLQAPQALCPDGILDPGSLAERLPSLLPGFTLGEVAGRGRREVWARRTLRLKSPESDQALVVTASRFETMLRRVSFEVYALATDRPIMMVLTGGDCLPRHGRAIRHAEDGTALELVHFTADLATVERTEPLNPPLPEGQDPGGVTVAHIDSGVNYLLPEIAARLARDEAGRMLGLDLWDEDGRPFDGDAGRSVFFPIRHGTPVASLLVKEAPNVRLLPIRYPRPDMTRMARAVEAAAEAGARVVAMPMGSRRPDDWTAFAEAAAAHPEVLFVVSAGNNGHDIDRLAVYPASLPIENMIVVTSSDAFGRLAPGSNWGAFSVDLMVPAENLEVIDYRGARGQASGSSYAVPRVAALAARLLEAAPDWTTAELKRAIFARAVRPLDRGAPKLAVGWLPNPAEDR